MHVFIFHSLKWQSIFGSWICVICILMALCVWGKNSFHFHEIEYVVQHKLKLSFHHIHILHTHSGIFFMCYGLLHENYARSLSLSLQLFVSLFLCNLRDNIHTRGCFVVQHNFSEFFFSLAVWIFQICCWKSDDKTEINMKLRIQYLSLFVS